MAITKKSMTGSAAHIRASFGFRMAERHPAETGVRVGTGTRAVSQKPLSPGDKPEIPLQGSGFGLCMVSGFREEYSA